MLARNRCGSARRPGHGAPLGPARAKPGRPCNTFGRHGYTSAQDGKAQAEIQSARRVRLRVYGSGPAERNRDRRRGGDCLHPCASRARFGLVVVPARPDSGKAPDHPVHPDGWRWVIVGCVRFPAADRDASIHGDTPVLVKRVLSFPWRHQSALGFKHCRLEIDGPDIDVECIRALKRGGGTDSGTTDDHHHDDCSTRQHIIDINDDDQHHHDNDDIGARQSGRRNCGDARFRAIRRWN